MYYRCNDLSKLKIKDASGADVKIEEVSEIAIIHINALRGTITVYPNVPDIGKGYSKIVTVNTTPVYIIAGGSLELTDGEQYEESWINWTSDPYPEKGKS